MADTYLQGLVINRCKELGAGAAAYFDVSESLVKQWLHGSKTPSLAAVEKVFVLPEQPVKEANWENKEVFIAAPFYKATNPATLTCLLGMWDRSKFGFRCRFGDAFIVHARNQLATDFLVSGMPYSLWIDDDMIFPWGNAAWYNQATDSNMPEKFAGMHTVNRLRSHSKSLVGGLYFGRIPTGRAMYAEAMQDTEESRAENARAHEGPIDLLKETDWVATGCLWADRTVFTDIQAKFPHLAPQHSSEAFHFFTNTADALISSMSEVKTKAEEAVKEIQTGSAGKASQIIEDLLQQVAEAEKSAFKHNRLHQGEDQLFCRRAKQSGHQPHVDLGLVCGHLGQNVFSFHNTKN